MMQQSRSVAEALTEPLVERARRMWGGTLFMFGGEPRTTGQAVAWVDTLSQGTAKEYWGKLDGVLPVNWSG